MKHLHAIIFTLFAHLSLLHAVEVPQPLDDFNVVWRSQSAGSSGSMPIGNGDVGLNVWVEKNGELVFYIGKNDAWSGDLNSPGYGAYGLIKVGRVRISLDPSPFAEPKPFRQELKLREGTIVVSSEQSTLRVWVDANHPVIHVDAECAEASRMKVVLEPWRTKPTEYLNADVILPAKNNRISWYYRTSNKDIPELIGRTIGAEIEGAGLISKDDFTLESRDAGTVHHAAIHTLTAQCETPERWLSLLEGQVIATNANGLEQAYKAHLEWWSQFWSRSWIFVSGGTKTREVTQGYLLQRFKHACSSRGEYPIKFNGSIFNVDDPNPVTANDKKPGEPNVKRMVQMEVTADYRGWGYQYWFQNTRHMYWPMLMSGDFDLMQPLFKMYKKQLSGNTKQVREFYGHDGVYFRETAPFWGGLVNIKPEDPGYFTKHYYTPILELSAMGLDYYAYTGDTEFCREILLPIATGGVTFYDQHFKRDTKGKLLIDPANAIEMFWKVRNPTPDLAGLRFVLQGLQELPGELADNMAKERWLKFLKEIPPIPVGTRQGQQQILPFEEGQKASGHNTENPELYAIYPFRLYGVGKPDFELARNTFNARAVKATNCWHQDGVQAALTGDTATAQKNAISYFSNKDRRLRFPAFWAKGHDYPPDEDNGGNGMATLQNMLMQCDGKRILLLPAWPAEWDADFKLHAPMQTTIEASIHNGKVTKLIVIPESRRGDVVLGTGVEMSKP